MSKAIYQPTGKAREYAAWACNLHVGCSNDCDYCYCKRGALGTVMGKPQASLKSCFKAHNGTTAEEYAFLTFQKELMRYRDRIIAEGGLFFSFSTDPCLPETINLTLMCVALATGAEVPCRILTKCAGWILEKGDEWDFMKQIRNLVTVGFTLTGCDGKERGASPNTDRIAALKQLSEAGVKTFASVEPVIDFDRAEEVVRLSAPWCDEYRFGLLSGDRSAYEGIDLAERIRRFIETVPGLVRPGTTVFWKKSVRDVLAKNPSIDK